MADLYDPSPPVGDASLDDMMLYSDAPAEPHSVQDSTVDMGQNFAFDVNQMSTEQLEDAMLSSEGFSSNYIPHTSENDIQHMQAYSPHPNVDQVSFSAPSHVGNPFSWQSPSSVPPSQDAMTEFFKMMSHPENVQAYMHFLQTQHEQPPQAPISTAPIRSRSNSNPAASTLPSAFSLRPSTTDTLTDSSSREKKLAKYRTKRARRLTSSQISNSDTGPTSLLSAGVEGMEGDRFMPAPKMPKTLTHGTSRGPHSESFGATSHISSVCTPIRSFTALSSSFTCYKTPAIFSAYVLTPNTHSKDRFRRLCVRV